MGDAAAACYGGGSGGRSPFGRRHRSIVHRRGAAEVALSRAAPPPVPLPPPPPGSPSAAAEGRPCPRHACWPGKFPLTVPLPPRPSIWPGLAIQRLGLPGTSGHRVSPRGLKSAIIEGDVVGGTCVNRGCVPSKALFAVSGRMWELHDEHHMKSMGLQVSSAGFDGHS
ncbi:hypothetical protein ACP4OV_011430 [Aristida adscensionis]